MATEILRIRNIGYGVETAWECGEGGGSVVCLATMSFERVDNIASARIKVTETGNTLHDALSRLSILVYDLKAASILTLIYTDRKDPPFRYTGKKIPDEFKKKVRV